MWLAIFSALSAVVAVAAAIWGQLAVRNAVRAAESPLAKAHSNESRLLLLERSLNDQGEVLTELANRVKMMKVRSAVRHGSSDPDALPDPYRDPDGWRNAMNRRIASKRLNGD
jgi:hypothetical protein